MSVNCVSSHNIAAPITPKPEQNEVQRAGRDARVNNDADDKAAAPKSTTNAIGQTIGQLINTTA